MPPSPGRALYQSDWCGPAIGDWGPWSPWAATTAAQNTAREVLESIVRVVVAAKTNWMGSRDWIKRERKFQPDYGFRRRFIAQEQLD